MLTDLYVLSSVPRSSIYPNSVLKLMQVAHGLEYLHSQNVVHGDLRGVRCALPVSRVMTERFLDKYSGG